MIPKFNFITKLRYVSVIFQLLHFTCVRIVLRMDPFQLFANTALQSDGTETCDKMSMTGFSHSEDVIEILQTFRE